MSFEIFHYITDPHFQLTLKFCVMVVNDDLLMEQEESQITFSIKRS